MNEYGSQDLCSLALDYVSGVCTAEEANEFERHLASCPRCQGEIEELRLIWEVLPVDMDIIEPPADLKKQVMDAVMASEQEHKAKIADITGNAELATERRLKLPRLRYFKSWTAVIMLVVLAGSLWGYQLMQNQAQAIPTIEEALNVSAAQIKQLVPLTPVAVNEEQPSYGVACIVDNGSSKQFIVYVFGAKETKGEEAYQVWLIDDGKRRSAGTFKVEEKMRGIGVLSMPIASNELSFDAIGITLEPDDRGDQPRGAKVFGSAT